jgi:hypothetical protein
MHSANNLKHLCGIVRRFSVMKIVLNAAETRFRNRDEGPDVYQPATLEIREDLDDENGFTVGLIVTADRRDVEVADRNVVRVKAAWTTPREFAKWVGRLVSCAALLGLTDSDEE